MPRSPDLLRLIDRIARERGMSQGEMAAFIGVHRSSFVHARAGRQPLTSALLARIVRAFPEREAELKELAYHYLRAEIALDADASRLPASYESASDLLPHVLDRVRRYVRQFPRFYLEGRSLAVTGDDARDLSAAAALVVNLFESARVPLLRRDGQNVVRASERDSLVRVRLLVVDRVEFASVSILSVLLARLDVDRPFVLTSARDLAAALPADIAPRLISHCTVVPLAPPAASQ